MDEKTVKENRKRNKHILNKIKPYMPKSYDKGIHAAMLVLLVVGSIIIMSTVVGSTTKYPGIVQSTAIKQIFFVIVSYWALTFFAKNFSLTLAYKTRMLWIVGIVALLCLSLFSYNALAGSRAWIEIPGLGSIQPSEFVKGAMIVLMAIAVEKYRNNDKIKAGEIIKGPIIMFVVCSAIIFIQPDFGTFAIIALICAFCFLIPTNKQLNGLQKIVAIALIILIICIFFFVTPLGLDVLTYLSDHNLIPISPYQIMRFKSAIDPSLDSLNTGYQLMSSLFAFASGSFFGKGFGASTQKFGHLPEAQTDYILAVLVEEFGLIGFAIVVIAYWYIVIKLFKYAFNSKQEGAKIIYAGTAIYMFIHFFLNVGGVSGLIPLTGIPLLFLSSGGSSLLAIMIMLGICQALIVKETKHGIARRAKIKKNST